MGARMSPPGRAKLGPPRERSSGQRPAAPAGATHSARFRLHCPHAFAPGRWVFSNSRQCGAQSIHGKPRWRAEVAKFRTVTPEALRSRNRGVRATHLGYQLVPTLRRGSPQPALIMRFAYAPHPAKQQPP